MGEPGTEFFDRTEEIGLIENTLVSIREGSPANICFSGIPGSGKTSLILKYISDRSSSWHDEGVILAHIPLSEPHTGPADLAKRIAAGVCAGFLKAVGDGDASRRILNEDTFPDEARRLKSLAVESFLDVYERFRHSGATGEEDVLRAAAGFPEVFAAEKGLRLVLFADDFHAIQSVRLGSESQAADLLVPAVQSQVEVFWVVSVAPCLFTDKYFMREDGPLHRSFQFFPVSGLPAEQASLLAASVTGAVSPASDRVAKITAGIPLYLIALAQAAKKAASGDALTDAHVERAFVSQVLGSFGSINRHFEETLAPRATKEDIKSVRAILGLLSSGKKLDKDELARVTGRGGRELGAMLSQILTSGLFRRVGNSYYFDDPLFRFWAGRTSDPSASTGSFERLSSADSQKMVQEYETGMTDDSRTAARSIEEPAPENKPQAARSEKVDFRRIVSRIKGRTLDAALFGAAGEIRFPDFDRVQGFAFTSKDIKVYYLSGDGRGWVMLVVWRQGALGPRFVEVLSRRAAGRADGMWFVGRGGFTEEAVKTARELGVYISSESDLKRIMEE